MAQKMSLPLYYEWRAFAEQNPFTESRADWRAAMMTANMLNMMSSLWSKSKRRYKVKDFMPHFKSPRRKTPGEMYRMIKTAVMLSMPTRRKDDDG